MIRFFVMPGELEGEQLILVGENAAHAKVLRLRVKEQVLVCDGEGQECLCCVTDVNRDAVSLDVLESRVSTTEPKVQVSVYMALPKADKLEHVIQKATELGAHEIVTFPSARCVSRPDQKSLQKKLERWRKIATAAAEQSGRGKIPNVVVLDSYEEALLRGAQADLPLLFYENETATTLHMALEEKTWGTVSLMTGPEGGLEASEVEKATEAGFHVCTLGSRILRCETAPLCALSVVMYAAGEF